MVSWYHDFGDIVEPFFISIKAEILSMKRAALPANTQYYLEEYMNSLIKKEKFTLRTDNRRRKQAITVLNFLVSKGSTPGFRMRDEII